ncbi:MAG: formyl-CoA transferase [Deltaproteobacteria bacterium CG_4_8_14_3_um_filter_45_9]|nr:MAG: formyl-CoA transferase [Deltaproteobacteria bacterium CG_4_8_14_3_um_filter_45_9]
MEEWVGLLKELKMLDLSRLLPGPYCSLLLADLGMEVLKIEDPELGDYMRVMGPARKKDSAYFLALNRNKKSMLLNLKTKEGKEIFFNLIATYDILLEGFRPGVMDRLGIGYQELKKTNPRVIFCSLSGYGQDGPYKERSGHDINYIGLGGILELTGSRDGDPIIPGVQIADIGGGGMMAAIAILAAIVHREKTGEGQYLDVAMHDGVISWLSIHAGRYFMDKELPKRGEMHLSGRYACYQVYPTKDGRHMSLGALEPKFWTNFCEAVGRRDLIYKQFIEGEERLRVIEEVQNLFKTKTQEEWIDSFKNVDACCEPILTLEEVFQHPQVLHRKMVMEYEHPVEGKIRQVGNPIKSSRFPFEIRTPAPAWGEHTMEVLKEIGYSEEEIKHFKKVKAI